MSTRYKEYQQLNLPAIGEEILAKWKESQAFEKSVSLREGNQPFVFYEGPPSANGMPGIHHVISRTLKDLVCRYKTMQGFQVKRKGGWDTHGLPVELGVEKELGITKEDIGKKISVEEYNRKCREAVLRYKDKWDEITQKSGYWVDLNSPYITFENNYIETLWWCLGELYKKGYLYESVSIQPYSPAAGTGLSSHELNQPGTYKDVKDTSAVAMFKVVRDTKSEFLFKAIENRGSIDDTQISNLQKMFDAKTQTSDTFFLAWTTTPWTLPSNLGLTVGSNIDYVLVETYNPYLHVPINVILAKQLLNKYFDLTGIDINSIKTGFKLVSHTDTKKLPEWKILAEFKGSEIESCKYEQLLPSEANTLEKIQEITPGAQPFRVILGDFVTTEDGTGIVHTAPAFGADDFKVGKKNNLGILTLVDKEGKFVDGVGEFSGRYVKNYKDQPDYVDVNVDISVKLKLENRAFKIEKYEHNYPHCWRTDKPIIYYPLDAWFIKTTAVKDRMVELNKTINWKPAATGTGRFGNWLENMVDWNLSRSRFWGTPLPVWKTLAHYSPFKKHDVDDLGDYDELCVGAKGDLLSTSSKLGWDVQGYVIDFDRLTREIREENSEINEKIKRYNIGKETEYTPLYSIDIDKLKSVVVQRNLNSNDIRDFIIPVAILKDYLQIIDVELLDKLDLHKPYIDNVIFIRKEKSGSDFIYVRVPDLIDVWFDSGAMPYAQWGLDYDKLKNGNPVPFGEGWDGAFPADFIAEGVDQTRGWFYTLHALGVLLFDSVAYKTVVSNGLVLDKNGNKMSKRLGNVVDPFETINKYGADATRWYLITNASPWDSLKFDLGGIQEVQRKFFGTLYNTYQFFALYANVDGFAFKENYVPVKDRPEIDQWILSSLNTLIKTVQQNMDEYEPTQAGRAIEDFVDEHLSNWYVRLCRRRFWKGEYEHDKVCAYQTLYECLETLSLLIAPIAPFFAEWLFSNLNEVSGRYQDESVHHVLFPKVKEEVINTDLEKRMQLAQDASSLILSLRKKVNIKVRQPLQKVMIPALDEAMVKTIKDAEDIIKTETNIKEIEILQSHNNFIRKKAKANFKTLGKKLGAKMKWAAEKIGAFGNSEIEALDKGDITLTDDTNESIVITREDVEVSTDEIPGFEVAGKGSLTVALDITITEELKKEGDAREFVNRIQNIRKESGFELTDRIAVKVLVNEGLQPSLIQYKTYICAEILADSLAFEPVLTDGIEIEVNSVILKVNVLKN